MYFRANVLFRNFEVKGGADKTLIYLTLHAVQCLVKCEKIEDKNSGMNDGIKVITYLFLSIIIVIDHCSCQRIANFIYEAIRDTWRAWIPIGRPLRCPCE